MKVIAQLICSRWVLPLDTVDELILENHAVAVDQSGKIMDILPIEKALQQYQPQQTINLDDHVLMAGLINAHTHSPMSLFRGLADDLPLMTWLTEHIWPAEQKWVNQQFIKEGSQLAIAEMLKNGITCFNDMYFNPDLTATVAAEAGIRAVVGLIMIDFPSVWATDSDDYLKKGIAVHQAFKNNPLIHTAFAPHAPYTVSDQPLMQIKAAANDLNIPIHIHLHETEQEIQQSLETYQMRPLARLDKLGLLDSSLMAVHMVHLNEDEIQLVAKKGVHIVHCPQSNLKLASGFAPIQRLKQAGANIAIGTDGASSNNDLNLFSELQTAAMLAKAVANDASALPAYEVLKMATINGAKALGISDITGSLAIGKAADMIAIDLNRLQTRPLYHVVSQLVYAVAADQVSDVWVNGQRVVENHQLTTLNEKEILNQAAQWAEKIKS